jgi:hypothetical protein
MKQKLEDIREYYEDDSDVSQLPMEKQKEFWPGDR